MKYKCRGIVELTWACEVEAKSAKLAREYASEQANANDVEYTDLVWPVRPEEVDVEKVKKKDQ